MRIEENQIKNCIIDHLQLYRNTNNSFNEVIVEINDSFSDSFGANDFKYLIEKKEEFESIKDGFLSGFAKLGAIKKNEPNHDNTIVQLNKSQIKINMLSLENLMDVKSDFLKDYPENSEYNKKINQESFNAYINSMAEIHKSETQKFNEQNIIGAKNLIHYLRNSYIRTMTPEFARLMNMNTEWLIDINNSLAHKYVTEALTLKDLENAKNKLANIYSDRKHEDYKTNRKRLLFLEEEMPKKHAYIEKLKSAFYAVTAENTYKPTRN